MTSSHEIEERVLPTPAEVKLALRQILESHPFKTSKQCQDLLRYIVDRSLTGNDASLRERIIGIEVFGRQPTYDTAEDPVVRVRAADVRKRLAQYYQSLEPGASVLHIELQPGSYRVTFRDVRVPPSEPTSLLALQDEPEIVGATATGIDQSPLLAPKRIWFGSRKSLRIAAALAAVSLILAGAWLWMPNLWRTPQDRFWAPFTSAHQPTLLYLGTNAAYVFSLDYLEKYRTAHHLPNNGPELFVDLAPDGSVRTADLLPVQDTFVTVGDLAATVQVASLLRGWKLPFVLRSGRDLSIGDLRNQPSVMIGAFNNPWTLELTNDLPFSFRKGIMIQDRDHPDKTWSKPSDARSSSTTDDYALISRLLVSKTGGPLVTVAGIGQFGTQAAAEFVTSPEKMRDLLKTAPRGWENKNMQAVLHIKVVGYAPVSVEVVATSYW